MLAAPALLVFVLSWPQGGSPAPGSALVTIPDHGLTLDLACLQGLADSPPTAPVQRAWTATHAGSAVRAGFRTFDAFRERFLEPEDVVETWRDEMLAKAAEARGESARLGFEPVNAVRAPVGSAPILATARATVEVQEPRSTADMFLIGGLTDKVGWALCVEVEPALSQEARARLAAALEGCARWQGLTRDPRWSDDEVKALFARYAPESARKRMAKPLRTEHFLVLSSHDSANQYARSLEKWHAQLEKVLPLEEQKDRRLLPVLVFRHDEEFRAFAPLVMDEKEREEGGGWGPWCDRALFATHFENDYEASNVRALAKYLLLARVRGYGANEWFRTGIGQYCSTRTNERGEAVRALKKKKYTPLDRLLDDAAWTERAKRMEMTGIDDEASYSVQSALWIEFLRESAWAKDKFATFVRTVGAAPKGDAARVRAALEAVYGVDLMELEKRWYEYGLARK